MTLSEIANYRLINQQFSGTKFKSAAETVQWFAAMQGQEYAQTKWGLGLRLPDTNDKEIERDFSAGKILRTHLLRPTWHFVSGKDIRWLLILTAARVHVANAFMYRKLELKQKVFDRCHDILLKMLQGGKQLTRKAIMEGFLIHNVQASGFRLSYIMMYAELEGIVCSGARNGNQFTYALLDERVVNKETLDKEEALLELTKRYFRSRGPATIQDFSTWSGLTLTECKKGLEMGKSGFIKEGVEDSHYYFTEHVFEKQELSQNIYPLPIYDEFIMGYKDRSAYFQYKKNLRASSKGHYDCMILYKGQIIGTWKRTIKQKSIAMEYDFFTPLNKDQSMAFDIAVNRLAEFTGMPVCFEQ